LEESQVKVRGLLRANLAKSAAAETAFRARLAELGATLLEPEWLGARNLHRVRCPAGHEIRKRPADLAVGEGLCRTCAGQDPAVNAAAFEASLARQGVTLLEPYKGSHRPHEARCAAGHECFPWPASVRRGLGACRACAGLDPKAAERAFRNLLAEHGAILLEPYKTAVLPHRVRCSAGHECSPMPGNLQRGQGICRICAGKVWDAFYVVLNPVRQHVKFGITSGDPRARLGVHRGQGFREVMRSFTGLPGSVAPDIERATLAALRLAGITPVRGREYYDVSALAVIFDVADNFTGP
jgi:hypothetical protein